MAFVTTSRLAGGGNDTTLSASESVTVPSLTSMSLYDTLAPDRSITSPSKNSAIAEANGRPPSVAAFGAVVAATSTRPFSVALGRISTR